MKKISTLILMVCGLFIFTACNKTPEQRAEKFVDKVSSKLDLTKEQESKLVLIKDKYFELRSKQNHSEKKDKVEKLILSKTLDDKEVQYLYEAKQRRMNNYYKEIYPLLKDFHASLNDEQKQDVVNFMNKIHKKFHQ